MVIEGIALKEIRSWDAEVVADDVTAAIAACETAFGDAWAGTASLIQHVAVQLQHKGELAADFVAAVGAEDKDAIEAAINATSFDDEHKAILLSRVQLHWDDVVDAPDPAAVAVGPVTIADTADAEPAPEGEGAAEEVSP